MLLESHFWMEFLHGTIGILAIVNPIGALPVFLAVTAGLSGDGHIRAARQASLTVGIALIVTVWLGELLLSFFGVGIPAFRVGGGILILLMAISMMHAKMTKVKHESAEADEGKESQTSGVVPIGIPLLAGPGSIALLIVKSAEADSVLVRVFLSIGVVLVCLVVYLTLRMSATIQKRIGQTGVNIFTRIMGLILAAISIEFIAMGLAKLFPALVAVPGHL